jgi:hypothetical protein
MTHSRVLCNILFVQLFALAPPLVLYFGMTGLYGVTSGLSSFLAPPLVLYFGMTGMLLFCPDRVVAIREMRRVLRVGGRLFLSVWRGLLYCPLGMGLGTPAI